MSTIRHATFAALAALATTALPAQAPPEPPRRAVDLAICLDTSGSMNGLLDAARQNIWAIVNDLALAKPAPRLRIALVTFGNDGHHAEVGWVRVDTPFTDDLDRVSQQLFALTTNGGTEYVARAVQTAVDTLAWSTDADALRVVVVAGNEGADQDPQVDFRAASAAAIARGIVVDSIYCGGPADALAPLWREVATRADGAFAAIDQDRGTVVVATPFDARLAELGTEVNATYVPYGGSWAAAQENQVRQDANAGAVNPAAAAQRAICKATGNYSCASWDLVDALKQQSLKLDDVKAADLPEALRAMTKEQLRAHVDAMAAKRAALHAEIERLRGERDAFVAAEMKRRAVDGGASFEFAVRRAVRAQAEAKGFAFPPAPTTAAVAK